MATKINRREEIIARLFAEGKAEIMDSPEAIAQRESLDEYMEEARREYLRKAHASQIEASRFIITS
ncbi:hypothetical protein [Chitinophaga ginsengisoli]|uniref:Uncharacterized protein n=1 Tax=Chitinophaga ginsengisoli TaxID=363837 RepID=A0A2P8GAF2_9BACT|nr:hypothetical protein [Chitinophaga ginsengisoli]PSL30944.1 hypothetical protein CLV42_105305 [Chitinophaga ginsengisoli]